MESFRFGMRWSDSSSGWFGQRILCQVLSLEVGDGEMRFEDPCGGLREVVWWRTVPNWEIGSWELIWSVTVVYVRLSP